jgi:hypothetical protein
MRRSIRLAFVLLAASCSTPDDPPPTKAGTPVIAQAEPSAPEATPPRVPAAAEPVPPEGSASEPPTPATPTPWGAPLQITGKTHGLRFTTTAQVFRTNTTMQLALDVELHNTTRAPIPTSLNPPLATVMITPAPGATGEGLGLGMRGEGMGSDPCSPIHGGPFTLRPDDRATVPRKLVELDPLPWPPGQAQRVTATSRDCRPDRLSFEVIDVTIIQPASPDGVPTLVPTKPSAE